MTSVLMDEVAERCTIVLFKITNVKNGIEHLRSNRWSCLLKATRLEFWILVQISGRILASIFIRFITCKYKQQRQNKRKFLNLLAFIEATNKTFPKLPQNCTQLSNNLLLFKWSFWHNHERIFIQFSIKKGRKKRIKSKRV